MMPNLIQKISNITSTALYDSPLGPLTLGASESGIYTILYGDYLKLLKNLTGAGSKKFVDATIVALDSYFSEGALPNSLPQMDITGSDKAIRVYTALLKVPSGKVVSYSELASMAGLVKAQRFVGTTMGKNPLPLLIPCHRVIKSNNILGNYGHDPKLKEWLLKHEGLAIKNGKVIPG